MKNNKWIWVAALVAVVGLAVIVWVTTGDPNAGDPKTGPLTPR